MAEAMTLNEADFGNSLQAHETLLFIFERNALFMLEDE